MAYDRKDHYYRKAKKEGKASRAAYKLAQLNERFHLIRRGDRVIDLGAAPGGWLQELSHLVGPLGHVIGIDILPLKIPLASNVSFISGNIEDATAMESIRRTLEENDADVVLSDMAPNTLGVAFADAYRSFLLANCALKACGLLLKNGGTFIVKIFTGGELEEYRKKLRQQFSKITSVTPPATRKGSAEIYLVCTGYKKTR